MIILDQTLLSLTCLAAAFDFVWRSILLALFCWLLALAFRKRSAEFRDQLWRAVLFALWTLPLLSLFLPPLFHPSLISTIRFDSPALLQSTLSPGIRVPIHSELRAPDRFPWFTFLASLYSAVALLSVLRLACAIHRVRRIVSRSSVPAGNVLRNLVHEVWLQSEATCRPHVRLSRDVRIPLVVESDADIFILLPANAMEWSENRLRLVLTHEMGHVRRNDPAMARLSWFTACLFWFHPLAWFLRSRLGTTAEECCDELVLQRTQSPHDYAAVLLEFAEEVSASQSRILQPASAFLHSSRLERRIDHIFAVSQQGGARKTFLRAMAIALFVPALYFAAAARSAPPQAPTPPLGIPHLTGGSIPTKDEVKQLEEQLALKPDDLEAHRKLLLYYVSHSASPEFTRELVWMIEHHPDDGLASLSVQPRDSDGQITRAYMQVESAWQTALSQNTDSAIVFLHAGQFYLLTNAERAMELFRMGREVAPANQVNMMITAMANLYVRAVWSDSHERFSPSQQDPAFAEQLRNDLDSSVDAALVSRIGSQLVSIGKSVNDPRLTTRGFELLEKAIRLDPNNQSLNDALESARTSHDSSTVRIGAKVAEANLVTKVEPIYPQTAYDARLQGTVVFTVTIAADGHVEKIRLEHGHPLLVDAAREAVLQYKYKPTRLDGKPVEVTTEVAVPFVLER